MCTYQTEKLEVSGSGKGAEGWFSLSGASVYLDHPAHYSRRAQLEHRLSQPRATAPSRVAVELDPGSARALAQAILATLEAVAPRRAEP